MDPLLKHADVSEPEPLCQDNIAPVSPAMPADPQLMEKIGKGLHDLYDGVPNSTLPIYFGPVLGELYLTPSLSRRSA